MHIKDTEDASTSWWLGAISYYSAVNLKAVNFVTRVHRSSDLRVIQFTDPLDLRWGRTKGIIFITYLRFHSPFLSSHSFPSMLFQRSEGYNYVYSIFERFIFQTSLRMEVDLIEILSFFELHFCKF